MAGVVCDREEGEVATASPRDGVEVYLESGKPSVRIKSRNRRVEWCYEGGKRGLKQMYVVGPCAVVLTVASKLHGVARGVRGRIVEGRDWRRVGRSQNADQDHHP